MADFLTRLVQRTSGRAPVIKPLVRSSYGSSLQVHETVDEFKETVSFDEIGTPASSDTPRPVSNTVLTAGRENTESVRPLARSENDNQLVEPPITSPVSRQPSGRDAIRNSKQVSAESKTAPSRDINSKRRKTIPGRKITNRQIADDVTPPMSQKNINAAGNVIQRKSIGKAPELGNVKIPQKTALSHAAREDTLTPPSRQNISARKDLSESITRTKQAISPKGERAAVNLKSTEKAVGRRQIPAEAAPSVPRHNILISDASVQSKSVGNIPGHETTTSRQPSVLARTEDELKTTSKSITTVRETKSDKEMTNRQMTAPSMPTMASPGDSSIAGESVRGLSPDLVISRREESAKPGLQGNHGEQQSTVENLVKYTPDISPARTVERALPRNESPPSPDIHVTIGRVEIRAVQQPERKAKRIPSAPRKPVVSLDAYLKGRNEEKR